MALATLFQAGVALAAAMVDDLRVTIIHDPWVGQSVTGAPVYGPAVSRRALVEPASRRLLGPDGREQLATTKLTLLDATPVHVQDRITLADGSRPVVLAVTAPPLTSDGVALLWEVWTG